MTNVSAGAADATWTKVADAGRKTFKDTTGLVNACCDGIDYGTKYIPIDKGAMTWIKGVNFASTLAGSGVAAGEQIYNIATTAQDPEGKKLTLYLINLARDVSYVALGAIGLFFVVTATPIVPWMILACLTSGLALTIGGFFYERLVDPENKGKNLNPAAVVENVVAQRVRV